MKYLLKIDKKFWDKIVQGHKTNEYRKMNKRHIKKGDTIYFCDLECKEVFGSMIVKDVNILATSDLFDEMYSGKNDIKKIEKETFIFIERNYIDEDYILEFELEGIKTPR